MPILIRKAQSGLSTNNKLQEVPAITRILSQYPTMKKVYGERGENVVIKASPNFHPKGYGTIEYFGPDQDDVSYDMGINVKNEVHLNPGGKGKHGILYNPNDNNEEDIYLDLLHGMHNDPKYKELREEFKKQALNDRREDAEYYYQEDVKNGKAEDGKERWMNNYVDGLIRSELSSMTEGDYAIERTANSKEMKRLAENIKFYLTKGDALIQSKKSKELINKGFIPEKQDKTIFVTKKPLR